MSALLNNVSTEIPANLQPDFAIWSEGFDACTIAEQTGRATVSNPYVAKQGALWQSGYNASQKVTEMGNNQQVS